MRESFPNTQEATNKEREKAEKTLAIEKCQKILDEFDEKPLEDIFTTILEKAGVPDKKYQYIPFRDVHVEYDMEDKYTGRSSSMSRSITINAAHLSTDTPAHLCKVMIHEELHALSRGEEIFNDEKGSVTGAVGFREDEWEEGTNMLVSRSFELFNEGMTELVADDVFATYMHRTGNNHSYRQHEGQNMIEGSAFYKEGRVVVNSVIEQIAADSGVDSERVREDFVRCYFEGSGLTPHKGLLENVLGASVSKNIQHLTTEQAQQGFAGTKERTLYFLMFDYAKRSLLA